MTTPMTGKQRRHLRGLGHELDPVVQVGKEGVSDALVKALDVALRDHELVKVKLGQNSPDERHEAAQLLASETRSEVAQILGSTILLYRERADDPEISLPGNKKRKPVAAATRKKPAPVARKKATSKSKQKPATRRRER